MNTSLNDQEGPVLEEDSLTMTVMFSLLEGVLMVWICFGNGLVLVAVMRCERLQTMSNVFVVNLSVADILVGLFLIVHIAMFLKPELLDDQYVCVFRYCTLLVTMKASVMGLVLLTLERFCAVLWPLHITMIITKERLIAVIIVKWIYSFISGLVIPMLWHNELGPLKRANCNFITIFPLEVTAGFLIAPFTFFIFLNVALYGKIFHVASKLAQSMNQVIDGDIKNNKFKSNMKLTKTGAVVLGVFVGCWMPFGILALVQVIGNLTHNAILNQMRTFATILAICNSGVNPIIYAFRVSTFNREFKKILRIKSNQVEEISFTN